ncbi:Peroxisome chaperone and import receptor [Entomophthora muscae]|uniref:Peroxisome chaperone and import receptor n=1 Tax=Entomophthora muscae TaxID=34485 RepID=A0ACC2TKF1_9FUNG|nr:Peroxisome chaperone and import receptor [Entomophthora muscae]
MHLVIFSKKAKSPEASPVNNAEPEQEISFEEEFARQLNLEMQGLLGPTEGEDLKASFEKMLSGDAGSSDHLKSFQSTINNTMNKLKNSSDQVKAEVKEDTPEALMEQLMRQMEGLSDSPDFEKAIEGMMGQIMTKDLLYEPMKDLTDKYPEWLALNKEKISADDYALYSQQQKIVSEVVESFEKQSTDDKGEVIECEENSKLQKRVMQLMQEVLFYTNGYLLFIFCYFSYLTILDAGIRPTPSRSAENDFSRFRSWRGWPTKNA